MSVLSGAEIKGRLESKELEQRLVVSPIFEDGQLKPDQASIDVRLGFEFAFVTPSAFGSIDEFAKPSSGSSQAVLSSLFEREYVPFGAGLTIHPHQFLLATTLEYLRLPSDLMAYVVGRSTWGRLGLIVATAVGIHPRFAGSLTLELRNLGETPLTLYPGQTIAQLFFHEVKSSEGAGAGNGQYIGAVDMVPRSLSSSDSYGRLAKLREKRNSLKSI